MRDNTVDKDAYICKVANIELNTIMIIIRLRGKNGRWTGPGKLVKTKKPRTGRDAIEVHALGSMIGYIPEYMVEKMLKDQGALHSPVTVSLSCLNHNGYTSAKLYKRNGAVKTTGVSRLSDEEKRNLLIQRGFSAEEIEGRFEDYINGTENWYIETVDPKEVSESFELEVIAKLFQKDSVANQGFHILGEDFVFEQYSSIHQNSREKIPNASALDPFVARLVFAVNKCCIFTLMSCDGWHERDYGQRELTLWMQSRYDTVWFWIIAERVFGETGPRKYPDYNRSKNWINSFEPENKLHRGVEGTKVICHIKHLDAHDIYKRINQYACFLEETSDELCAIREKWIASLQSEKSDREIDYQTFPELKEMILASVEEDLQRLHHKWNEVHQELEEKSREGVQAWDFCYY